MTHESKSGSQLFQQNGLRVLIERTTKNLHRVRIALQISTRRLPTTTTTTLVNHISGSMNSKNLGYILSQEGLKIKTLSEESDMVFNIATVLVWRSIPLNKKQRQLDKDNLRENRKRVDYDYQGGDRVYVIRDGIYHKLEGPDLIRLLMSIRRYCTYSKKKCRRTFEHTSFITPHFQAQNESYSFLFFTSTQQHS